MKKKVYIKNVLLTWSLCVFAWLQWICSFLSGKYPKGFWETLPENVFVFFWRNSCLLLWRETKPIGLCTFKSIASSRKDIKWHFSVIIILQTWRMSYQKHHVGLLVQRSGHADPLLLSSWQDDALQQRHKETIRKTPARPGTARDGPGHPASCSVTLTRSPTSVWSPCGRMSMSGCREQASITALYLQTQAGGDHAWWSTATRAVTAPHAANTARTVPSQEKFGKEG